MEIIGTATTQTVFSANTPAVKIWGVYPYKTAVTNNWEQLSIADINSDTVFSINVATGNPVGVYSFPVPMTINGLIVRTSTNLGVNLLITDTHTI